MVGQIKPWGLLLGRILLAQIFLLSGAMKIMQWSKTADSMAEKGMAAVSVFLVLAIIVELGAGLGVLLGWFTRCSAITLALYLIPVTLVFHNFWTFQGQMMENQMQHFLKNVTIMGGLITLAAAGAGRFSVDEAGGAAAQVETRQPERRTEALVR
jgi:putative oxidoreductase